MRSRPRLPPIITVQYLYEFVIYPDGIYECFFFQTRATPRTKFYQNVTPSDTKTPGSMDVIHRY